MAGYKSILVISDQHFPYNHQDVIPFLRQIKKQYKPDKIINIGDEVDGHSISFHGHDPDLMAPSDELKSAIEKMTPIFEMFPVMDLVDSNHGSLVYRRGKFSGLPRHVFKSYREILGAPKGWHWHDDLIVRSSDDSNIYFCHSRGADVLKVSQAMGMSVVQGHHHSQFEIRYWGNKLGLYFGMTVGCLIDSHSLAFDYGKLTLKRPVIGVGIILNGTPKLLPMILNSTGRWIKKLV